MIIDARNLPDNTTIEADCCIVGAGAAGITLALDLATSKRRIAVFESGGFDYSYETQKLYEGDSVGLPYPLLVLDRLRFLGGSTNHWAGSCRPFDEGDFDGWPFGADTMDPYYRRAQEICQLGTYSYDPDDWKSEQDIALELGMDALLQNGVYQYSPPTRFGTVYRQALTSTPGISIYLNANLIRFDTSDNASEVLGLDLGCIDGRKFRARANWYVLAAGGIENPRLLLNSSDVQKPGLGNDFDLVGRYFMDHAYFLNTATLLLKSSAPKLGFYETHVVRGQSIQGYLAPTVQTRRRQGIPAFAFEINPLQFTDYNEFGRISVTNIFQSLKSGHVPDHLNVYVSKILQGLESRAEGLYHWKLRGPASVASINYYFGSPPVFESRVALNDNVDVLGMRRVSLDWRLPPDFEQATRRAHEMLAQDLGRTGLGRLRINFGSANNDLMQTLGTAHHHMGTTRMHVDARQGVVDEHCRIHGVANVFIAGSSVFPTYSFDDPTMTIVALALRLSDHLKSLSI
jgi:choline dehydrogenase-like flavoprotein